jgi:signal transduction histidine kinase
MKRSRKNARIIKSESDRIAAIIRNVLNFARQTTPNREPVDLGGLIDRVVDIMRPLSEKKQYQVGGRIARIAFESKCRSKSDSTGADQPDCQRHCRPCRREER